MINNTALTIFGIWVAIGIYVLILQYFFDKQVAKDQELENQEDKND